jgi:hypothetical protein
MIYVVQFSLLRLAANKLKTFEFSPASLAMTRLREFKTIPQPRRVLRHCESGYSRTLFYLVR